MLGEVVHWSSQCLSMCLSRKWLLEKYDTTYIQSTKHANFRCIVVSSILFCFVTIFFSRCNVLITHSVAVNTIGLEASLE